MLKSSIIDGHVCSCHHLKINPHLRLIGDLQVADEDPPRFSWLSQRPACSVYGQQDRVLHDLGKPFMFYMFCFEVEVFVLVYDLVGASQVIWMVPHPLNDIMPLLQGRGVRGSLGGWWGCIAEKL